MLLLLFLNFIQYSKKTYGSATAVSDSETREINIDIIRVDSLSKIFVGKKDHCKNYLKKKTKNAFPPSFSRRLIIEKGKRWNKPEVRLQCIVKFRSQFFAREN